MDTFFLFFTRREDSCFCTEGRIAVNSLAYYPDNTHAIHGDFSKRQCCKRCSTKSEVQKSNAQMLEQGAHLWVLDFGVGKTVSVVGGFRERFFSDNGESRKCFPWLLRHRKKRQYGTLCGNILWLKSCVFCFVEGADRKGTGEREKGKWGD